MITERDILAESYQYQTPEPSIRVDHTRIVMERDAIAAVATHMYACGLDGQTAETHLRLLALEAARLAVAEAVAKSRKFVEVMKLIDAGELEIGRAS